MPLFNQEHRIAELEEALRPFAKAWADRHQICDGQAVEINIDPEWVRYAAEVMILDDAPLTDAVKLEERLSWEDQN